MLDIQFIRENTDKVKKGVSDKQFDPKLVDRVLDVDGKRRKLIVEVEELRAKRNKVSEEKNIEEGKKIKEELKAKEPQLTKIEEEYNEIINQIPNLPLDATPIGKSEKDNVEVRKWGEPKKFDFTPKDHLELGKSLGILDFEAGAKVAGSQFYFWYREGAALELALVQYAMELLSKEGFIPVITPDLAKSRYYLGTGYMPKGNEAQTYEIKDEDLGLIATAEVTLAGKHADEIINAGELPLKYVGYSHCFRQEAGAYGKYSKGLYRVHQFTKVEMFIYCRPEESEKYHEFILEMEEKIYQSLGIAYRVVEMCTGDLGAMAARKFDLEAWMPTRGEYGEVTSTSNCTDYQARNLNIKFKDKSGENKHVHMLNGTAIATSRTPLAILENYQEKDGSVVIPEVLRKWVGKDKITPK
ncbi:serine--tRNA ligase [Candidatus Woesebacteria bacterium RIFCSPHIGHO2_12_FULL_42_9]|uniref:Serine--tRNA ligase n=2 Tax=Candidatus Woeseibacteriota TaxID=1752722 RepID=A0A1F8ASJ4_9BACT|nr:MAG: serine--tRNA ligase [Candidatus Woesebacteria bacterium GWA1_42_12]OGM54600.1 MAG: serine--tRNA ligase [Candidatus Woesebacteria bacterium RIFCSPHIGHO2_12_FULL_42_9]